LIITSGPGQPNRKPRATKAVAHMSVLPVTIIAEVRGQSRHRPTSAHASGDGRQARRHQTTMRTGARYHAAGGRNANGAISHRARGGCRKVSGT